MDIRQAIHTRYIGPTNTRGARVKATAAAGAMTVPWNHALGIEENHAAAAKAFADKFAWRGTWYGGGLDDHGYVFVCVNPQLSPDGQAFVIEGKAS